MKLEFDSVEEVIEFVNAIRPPEEKNMEEQDLDLITKDLSHIQTVKQCPYGFVQCPYNKDIPIYYPYKWTTTQQPYCSTDIGTSKDTEVEMTKTDNETITINLKDINNENNA